MAEATRLIFDYWLTFAGDRTPRQGGAIGMKPEPWVLELNENIEALATDEKRAAEVLDLAEVRFLDWVMTAFPEHNVGSWDVRLDSAEGPVVSRYWSGFFASE